MFFNSSTVTACRNPFFQCRHFFSVPVLFSASRAEQEKEPAQDGRIHIAFQHTSAEKRTENQKQYSTVPGQMENFSH